MRYTSAENNRANREIERWEMKGLGINPVNHYVSRVVFEILQKIPKKSDIDYYIIEDVITQNPDDFMYKNIYDFYEELIDETVAAEFFRNILVEYMLG